MRLAQLLPRRSSRTASSSFIKGDFLVICSVCEEGRIEQVRVNATDEIVYVCEECDALWFDPELIGRGGTNLEAHLSGKGLSALRDEVEVLSRDFDL
jgi:hypothetical protein